MIRRLRDGVILMAPLQGDLERCRVVVKGMKRCPNGGVSFPNLRIADEPLVVCGEHGHQIKNRRLRPVPAEQIEPSLPNHTVTMIVDR